LKDFFLFQKEADLWYREGPIESAADSPCLFLSADPSDKSQEIECHPRVKRYQRVK